MTSTIQAAAPRLLDASRSLAEHRARHGDLPWLGGPGRLVGLAEAAGLTGRGGAGFPTARKLAAVAAGDRAVVVGNGAEGEPASAKDRVLLSTAPHLVLDGLQLAAEAVDAKRAYLYVTPRAGRAPADAIAQRRAAGWDRVPVTLVEAPGTFVAGQESAVVAHLSGRRAVPGDNLRRVTEAGVHGAPTLVQNVETLAHLALLARYGPGWYRSRGTAAEPGTFLATVGGAVRTPGVYEASHGIPLGRLLDLAGGPAAALQAVLVGGYHGVWVPAEPRLPVSRAGLARYGGSPGAGVVIALPADACGLVASARIAGYLAGQSAGQCGPCRNGLPRLADALARLARRDPFPGLPAEIDRLGRLVTGRGACAHPDGTARFVASTLRAFAGEVDAHLAGRCTAGGRDG